MAYGQKASSCDPLSRVVLTVGIKEVVSDSNSLF